MLLTAQADSKLVALHFGEIRFLPWISCNEHRITDQGAGGSGAVVPGRASFSSLSWACTSGRCMSFCYMYVRGNIIVTTKFIATNMCTNYCADPKLLRFAIADISENHRILWATINFDMRTILIILKKEIKWENFWVMLILTAASFCLVYIPICKWRIFLKEWN